MDTLIAHVNRKPEISRAEWARRFGVSRPYIYGLLNGTRCPSPEVAARIQAATDGEVKVTDWPNIAAVVAAVRASA